MTKRIVIIPSDSIQSYELKGISKQLERYFNPSGFFDEVYVISPKEKKEFRKYGFTVIPIGTDREFRKIIKELKPYCVRSYGAYWATKFAVLNRVPGIPIISSIHDTNRNMILPQVLYSDYIFSMSTVLTSILKNFDFEFNRIIETGNRLDFETFKPMKKSNQKIQKIRSKFRNGKMLLFVGRLAPEKNLKTLIEALDFLNDDFFLVVIGRGELKINSDRIFHFPSIDNKELVYWYNTCDLFVMTSLWEGFGMVSIEAAACKVRMIVPDIEPINKIIKNTDPQIKFLNDLKNASLLAKIIVELVNVNEVGNDTYNFIRNKYSRKNIEYLETEFYATLPSLPLRYQKPFEITYFRLELIYMNLRHRLYRVLKPLISPVQSLFSCSKSNL